MGFSAQLLLQQQLAVVQPLLHAYYADLERSDYLQGLIQNFKIYVPFIGQFSSGKSSLVNALLENPVLPIDIAPETALPTELYLAQQNHVSLHTDTQIIELTLEQLRTNQLGNLPANARIVVQTTAEVLAKIPHLVLVDMPGWGSGIATHQRAIDDYLSKSLAYVIAVSVDEGTLRNTLRQALAELALHHKPVILVVTKAHKRSLIIQQEVVARLLQEMTAILGEPPSAVAVTSAAKSDVGELRRALEQLEQQAEQIFLQQVVKPWDAELAKLEHLIELRIHQRFDNAECLQAEIEQLQQQQHHLEQELLRVSRLLENKLVAAWERVQRHLQAALLAHVDTWAQRGLQGADISGEIINASRLAVADVLKNMLEPILKTHLHTLVEQISISPATPRAGATEQDASASSVPLKEIATVAAPLLLKLASPWAAAAAAFLPVVADFLQGSAARQQQAIALARQLEDYKQQLRGQLNILADTLYAQLQGLVNNQVQQLQQTLAAEYQRDMQAMQQLLVSKQQALQAGEAQVAALREQAQQDHATVQACRVALQPYLTAVSA